MKKSLLVLFLLIGFSEAQADNQFCNWNGTTEVCINNHNDDSGNVQTDESIKYNAAPSNDFLDQAYRDIEKHSN